MQDVIKARAEKPDNGKHKLNAIEQQKIAEKELNGLVKQQRADELRGRREVEREQKSDFKAERIFTESTGKRTRQDVRKLNKKAAKEAECSHLCEHGVNKCRICHPHVAKEHHRHEPSSTVEASELD